MVLNIDHFSQKELSWKEWWDSKPQGKKLGYCIIAVNAAVFVCWQVALWEPTMDKYFMSNLYGNSSYISRKNCYQNTHSQLQRQL